MFWHIWLRTCF